MTNLQFKKMNTKIGWIGTGVMGNAMALHLQNKGYELYVHSRTKSKCQNLIEKGAIWCANPKELAKNCDIIFTMVGYPNDVKEVILGSSGVLLGAKKNSILIDMTTSKPELATKIYKKAKQKRIHSLDAPVSGGDIGAKNGTLSIMVGGDKQTFEKIKPLFEILGKNIEYMGPAGSGQHTKMANQISIASTMIGTVETLMYAYKTELDLDKALKIIGGGSAGSWQLINMGPRIVKNDFEPGFYIKHFIKDMGIALDEASKMNLHLPGLKLAYQFYLKAKDCGYENLGTQALYKVFEDMHKQ